MFFSNRLLLLIYHRVVPDPDPLFPEQTTRQDFDQQACVLSRYFRAFPLDTAVRLLQRGELPPRSVAITFDDGYRDNYSEALPILQKYNLPAIFFVATGFLHGETMWNDRIIDSIRHCSQKTLNLKRLNLGVYQLTNDDQRRVAIDQLISETKYLEEPTRSSIVDEIVRIADSGSENRLMMSIDEVRQLSDSGMEIGAHTVTHPILTKASYEHAEAEIVGSRTQLQRDLKKEVNYFAYPNGRPGQDYDDDHCRIVKEAGFAGAVSTAPGCVRQSTDVYQMPRFGVWDKNPYKFALRLAYWSVRQ